MTSLLAVLLIIAIVIIVAMIIITTNKTELLRDWRRQISQLRDERSDAISRWRARLEEITQLVRENRTLNEYKRVADDRILYLNPFEPKFHSATMEAQRQAERANKAESDARTSRDAVLRGFNEFQELLTATRLIIPEKVITKGIEDGQSVKQIVLLYLQQVAERKSARRAS